MSDISPRHSADYERLFLAFLAGFSMSGEGYNAEYPFGDKGIPTAPALRPAFDEWVAHDPCSGGTDGA